MYGEGLSKDNCQSLFASLDILKFSFDVKIDGVMLLPYDEEGMKSKRFSDQVAHDVGIHSQSAILVQEEIKASNKDLKLYEKVLLVLATPVILSNPVVFGAGWLLYKARKNSHKGRSRSGFFSWTTSPFHWL